MFRRAVVALFALLATGIALRAQDTPRIWQGVYTTAQAERGKAVFNTTCLRCRNTRSRIMGSRRSNKSARRPTALTCRPSYLGLSSI